MIDEHLNDICAPDTSTLLEAVSVLDKGANALCCLMDDSGGLVAVLTDGDVRRALLKGAPMSAPALDFATTKPRTVAEGTSRALVIDLMRSVRISAVPEIDSNRRIVGLHTLSDFLGAEDLPNAAVIMAGGKGTRLGRLTATTPKPLMTVAGRTIIEWLVLGLVGDGIRTVFVSVNHLAEQIMDHLGDGSHLGCSIAYLREQVDKPLETAGSLTLLPEEIRTGPHPIIVMNGDLMVEFSAGRLIQQHRSAGARLTIGVRTYSHKVPFGVVDMDAERRVTGISEKPDLKVDINTAVYCVDPAAIGLLPAGEPSTMPELVQSCLDRGDDVRTWRINSEWIDVGTPADLARAKGHA